MNVAVIVMALIRFERLVEFGHVLVEDMLARFQSVCYFGFEFLDKGIQHISVSKSKVGEAVNVRVNAEFLEEVIRIFRVLTAVQVSVHILLPLFAVQLLPISSRKAFLAQIAATSRSTVSVHQSERVIVQTRGKRPRIVLFRPSLPADEKLNVFLFRFLFLVQYALDIKRRAKQLLVDSLSFPRLLLLARLGRLVLLYCAFFVVVVCLLLVERLRVFAFSLGGLLCVFHDVFVILCDQSVGAMLLHWIRHVDG
mmetsp:Transcript_15723/g.24920  ORF Transcript_15723/g.24920 Transcript_15723/m.24920 type:complete len:253 (-) Transcript_15723:170-928(-)